MLLLFYCPFRPKCLTEHLAPKPDCPVETGHVATLSDMLWC